MDTNFYLVAKDAVRNTKVNITSERVLDEVGLKKPISSVQELMDNLGQTIELASDDGQFIKALPSTFDELLELKAELEKKGLVYKVDFSFSNFDEHIEEQKKPKWDKETKEVVVDKPVKVVK